MMTELRMEMMSVMLSTACHVFERNVKLVKHRFSVFSTSFHCFPPFSPFFPVVSR